MQFVNSQIAFLFISYKQVTTKLAILLYAHFTLLNKGAKITLIFAPAYIYYTQVLRKTSFRTATFLWFVNIFHVINSANLLILSQKWDNFTWSPYFGGVYLFLNN